MIAIVDYGMGNVHAFWNMYSRMNIEVSFAKTPEDVARSERLILPGVGSFDDAMQRLDQSGLRPALEAAVLRDGKPLLGVCVGMQMLADTSEEGCLPGLGWVPGRVRRFSCAGLPLPHMGWNDVAPQREGGLFRGMENDARFYFLHSFYFECQDEEHALARTDYGGRYASAVKRGNVHGVQFHPEKSHHWGSKLLKNFAEL